MVDFCEICGQDTFICQKCRTIYCSNSNCSKGTEYHWDTTITGSEHAGAVCDSCYKKHKTNLITKNARNLEELVDIWGKPDAKYTTVTFGRYNSTTVDKVPKTYYDWAVHTLNEKNGRNRTKTNPMRESIPEPTRTPPKKETQQQPLESTHINYKKPTDFNGFLSFYQNMQKKVDEKKGGLRQ